MRPVILDASIVIKLLFPEADSACAREAVGNLAGEGASFHAPELLFLEVASAAWKRLRRGWLKSTDLADVQQALQKIALHSWSDEALAPAALEIASATGCTVFDAAYLALACHVDGVLLTADEYLLSEPVSRLLPGRVRGLGDVTGSF